MTTCTRCDTTGFLNLEQIPETDLTAMDGDTAKIQEWIAAHPDHDVQVCDCCGDGSGWYGEPGHHYTDADPPGRQGPYAENGGLCRCH